MPKRQETLHENSRQTRVKMHKSGKHWVRTLMSKIGLIRLCGGEVTAPLVTDDLADKSVSTATILKGAAALGALTTGALGAQTVLADDAVMASELAQDTLATTDQVDLTSTCALPSESLLGQEVTQASEQDSVVASESLLVSGSLSLSQSESLSESLSSSQSASASLAVSQSASAQKESQSVSLSLSQSSSQSRQSASSQAPASPRAATAADRGQASSQAQDKQELAKLDSLSKEIQSYLDLTADLSSALEARQKAQIALETIQLSLAGQGLDLAAAVQVATSARNSIVNAYTRANSGRRDPLNGQAISSGSRLYASGTWTGDGGIAYTFDYPVSEGGTDAKRSYLISDNNNSSMPTLADQVNSAVSYKATPVYEHGTYGRVTAIQWTITYNNNDNAKTKRSANVPLWSRNKYRDYVQIPTQLDMPTSINGTAASSWTSGNTQGYMTANGGQSGNQGDLFRSLMNGNKDRWTRETTAYVEAASITNQTNRVIYSTQQNNTYTMTFTTAVKAGLTNDDLVAMQVLVGMANATHVPAFVHYDTNPANIKLYQAQAKSDNVYALLNESGTDLATAANFVVTKTGEAFPTGTTISFVNGGFDVSSIGNKTLTIKVQVPGQKDQLVTISYTVYSTMEANSPVYDFAGQAPSNGQTRSGYIHASGNQNLPEGMHYYWYDASGNLIAENSSTSPVPAVNVAGKHTYKMKMQYPYDRFGATSNAFSKDIVITQEVFAPVKTQDYVYLQGDSGLVSAQEAVKDSSGLGFPSGTSFEWVDGAPSTATGGQFTKQVRITLPADGKGNRLSTTVDVPITVYQVVAKASQVQTYVGETASDLTVAKNFVLLSTGEALPSDATATFVTAIDNTTTGQRNAMVKVTFANGRTQTVAIPYSVDPAIKGKSPIYDFKGQDLTNGSATGVGFYNYIEKIGDSSYPGGMDWVVTANGQRITDYSQINTNTAGYTDYTVTAYLPKGRFGQTDSASRLSMTTTFRHIVYDIVANDAPATSPTKTWTVTQGQSLAIHPASGVKYNTGSNAISPVTADTFSWKDGDAPSADKAGRFVKTIVVKTGTDGAGHVATKEVNVVLTVNLQAPTITSDLTGKAGLSNQSVTVTATPGATVTLTGPSGATIGTAVADSTGLATVVVSASLPGGTISASSSQVVPTETGGTTTFTSTGNTKLATYQTVTARAQKIYALAGDTASDLAVASNFVRFADGSALPSSAQVTFVSKIDTASTVSQGTAQVKVVFDNGNQQLLAIPYTILPNLVTGYSSTAEFNDFVGTTSVNGTDLSGYARPYGGDVSAFSQATVLWTNHTTNQTSSAFPLSTQAPAGGNYTVTAIYPYGRYGETTTASEKLSTSVSFNYNVFEATFRQNYTFAQGDTSDTTYTALQANAKAALDSLAGGIPNYQSSLSYAWTKAIDITKVGAYTAQVTVTAYDENNMTIIATKTYDVTYTVNVQTPQIVTDLTGKAGLLNQTIALTGTPGAQVTLTDKAGNTVGSATFDTSGKANIVLSTALPAGNITAVASMEGLDGSGGQKTFTSQSSSKLATYGTAVTKAPMIYAIFGTQTNFGDLSDPRNFVTLSDGTAIPSDATVVWATAINTRNSATNPTASAKITFSDGSVQTVTVPYTLLPFLDTNFPGGAIANEIKGQAIVNGTSYRSYATPTGGSNPLQVANTASVTWTLRNTNQTYTALTNDNAGTNNWLVTLTYPQGRYGETTDASQRLSTSSVFRQDVFDFNGAGPYNFTQGDVTDATYLSLKNAAKNALLDPTGGITGNNSQISYDWKKSIDLSQPGVYTALVTVTVEDVDFFGIPASKDVSVTYTVGLKEAEITTDLTGKAGLSNQSVQVTASPGATVTLTGPDNAVIGRAVANASGLATVVVTGLMPLGTIKASTSMTGPDGNGGQQVFTASGNSKEATYGQLQAKVPTIYTYVGETASDLEEARNFVTMPDGSALPSDATVVFTSAIDTSSAGDKTATVQVTLANGAVQTVSLPYHVSVGIQGKSPIYDFKGQPLTNGSGAGAGLLNYVTLQGGSQAIDTGTSWTVTGNGVTASDLVALSTATAGSQTYTLTATLPKGRYGETDLSKRLVQTTSLTHIVYDLEYNLTPLPLNTWTLTQGSGTIIQAVSGVKYTSDSPVIPYVANETYTWKNGDAPSTDKPGIFKKTIVITTAIDGAGHRATKEVEATVTVVLQDATITSSLTGKAGLSNQSVTVTATPGATVTLTGPSGDTIGTAVADSTGLATVVVGDRLPIGKISASSSMQVPDGNGGTTTFTSKGNSVEATLGTLAVKYTSINLIKGETASDLTDPRTLITMADGSSIPDDATVTYTTGFDSSTVGEKTIGIQVVFPGSSTPLSVTTSYRVWPALLAKSNVFNDIKNTSLSNGLNIHNYFTNDGGTWENLAAYPSLWTNQETGVSTTTFPLSTTEQGQQVWTLTYRMTFGRFGATTDTSQQLKTSAQITHNVYDFQAKSGLTFEQKNPDALFNALVNQAQNGLVDQTGGVSASTNTIRYTWVNGAPNLDTVGTFTAVIRISITDPTTNQTVTQDVEMTYTVTPNSLSVSISQSQSLSAVVSQSLSTSLSQSESVSVVVSESLSESVSASESLSTSVSESESLSTSVSQSESTSASVSASESLSTSLSTSESMSTSLSTSESLSSSLSTSESLSTSLSTSESLSTSLSMSESLSTSLSTSESLSTSLSTSESLSTSLSTSESLSTSLSTSESLSTSLSTSESLSTSLSTSESLSTSLSTSESLSISLSTSESLSTSLSTSESLSTSLSTSESLSTSLSTSESLSTSFSTSESLSTSLSTSESLSTSFSTSESLSTSLSTSESLSTSLSTSESLSTSLSMSESLSTSLSTSESLSTSLSMSESLSTSLSTSESLSTSLSTSESLSTSLSTSESLSTSLSTSESLSTSLSMSESLSTSLSTSESLSSSLSTSESLSTSLSTSESLSTSLSTSESLSTSLSMSESLSSSLSTSESLSTSLSTSESLSTSFSTSESLSTSLSMSESLSTSFSMSESLSTSFSMSESLSTSLSTSESLSTSLSTSESLSTSLSMSESLSTSLSMSESLSTSFSTSESLSTSLSTSESLSTSLSTSESLSTSLSTSESLSTSLSTSESLSTSLSMSESLSTSLSTSESLSTSLSTSESLSTSLSTSESLSTSLSMSESLSTSLSMSESLSTSLSTSESLSTSLSTSESLSTSLSTSESLSTSFSTSESLSTSLSTSESLSTSLSTSESLSTSLSTSESLSTSLSMSESLSTSLSTSESLSTSLSTSESLSTSLSMSESLSTSFSTSESLSTSLSTSESLSTSLSMSESLSTSLSTSESLSTSFSTSESLSTSLSMSESLSTSLSTSESLSTSLSMSESLSTSLSTSESLSTSLSMSESLSTSLSTSESLSTSLSTSESLSTSLSTSESLSTSLSTSESLSTSLSMSESLSTSLSTSESLSTSLSTSESLSTSLSTSESLSTSLSTSESLSTSLSMSESLSTSLSMSESLSTSLSTSESLSTSLSLSESLSTSLSMSESLSTSLSMSESLSTSLSMSESLSTSLSMSESLSTSLSTSESLSTSLSTSESLSTSLSTSESLSTSLSTSESLSTSLSTSESLSTSLSTSESLSTSLSMSESLSTSLSTSESQSTSLSTSESLSTSFSTSESLSTSLSTSESLSTSLSTSESLSTSLSTSESLSTSLSTSESLSTSLSTSESLSTSLSTSESLSTSLSMSESLSTSLSTSESQSTSLSTSESLSTSFSTSESLSTSLSTSESLSTSLSTSESLSTSLSMSESLSTSLSTSESLSTSLSTSESLSTSLSMSESLSTSLSMSESLSTSLSTSESLSTSLSTSESLSTSLSNSESLSTSLSTSESLSTSLSTSESLSTSLSTSESLSTSLSTSESLSTSLSTSESLSTSLSTSESLSTSLSTSESLSTSLSMSESLSTSLSTSESLSTSLSTSESLSTSLSTSESLSTSLSTSESLSTSLSMSESLSTSLSMSESLSTSLSTSESLSTSLSTSESLSTSLSTSESLSTSLSTSESLSTSLSTSESLSTSLSTSESLSTSLSTSESLSTSLSMSESLSTSLSMSESLSTSLSTSESFSTSLSTSESLSTSLSTSESLSTSLSTSESLSTSLSMSESLSTSLSTSESLSTSLSMSESLSTSFSTSESLSTSLSMSESLSTSLSTSESLSTSLSTSESLSTSLSMSESLSTSLSTSESLSTSLSTSESLSTSLSTSESISTSLSTSESLSTSLSTSESLSTSLSTSESLSTSLSTSESLSTSLSMSESLSTSLSTSESLSTSLSMSESLSTSLSTSESLSTSLSTSESLSTSLSMSESLSTSLSMSESLSTSLSTSESLSTSLSMSESLSTSFSTSESLSTSLSTSESLSTSLSTSESLSTSLSMSESLSTSLSTSESLSTSLSMSESLSTSLSTSESLSTSLSTSESLSTSLSTSESLSTSLSTSESLSASLSMSESLSTSLSMSESLSTSLSTSESLSTSLSMSETLASSQGAPSLVGYSPALGQAALSQEMGASVSLSLSLSDRFYLSTSLQTGFSLSLSYTDSTSMSGDYVYVDDIPTYIVGGAVAATALALAKRRKTEDDQSED
ncbi:Rib/alpha-like domain-containing protein [Streptococcus sp. DD12]|uniref:Rib/alpha-like domain-containing protein n=1 Tax=Streptococcus sp. DD12 TaxID=1777880 RepID=UPI00079875FE|nr:Rib/alpha-like domain-containing protein [Streptococcus sp. DD12]KXT76458.1 putative cell-wall-anchored protein SasA (LPXTG motif) [Streptococcus sp. DD12]